MFVRSFILLLLMVTASYFSHISEAFSGNLNASSEYEEVFMPVMDAASVIIDDDDVPPVEPNLLKAKFLKYPPLSGIGERVDRLVYGIKTDIKPELDHYGYEIRRYMSHVGNIQIYNDNEFLLRQIVNVRKAGVIAEYWKKHLDKEISEIEKIIEENTSIELRIRTSFKQNRSTAQTFMIILGSWIDANKRLLESIKQDPDIYKVEYPKIEISIPSERVNFFNLYSKRQAKLKDIRRYTPFAMMVY